MSSLATNPTDTAKTADGNAPQAPGVIEEDSYELVFSEGNLKAYIKAAKPDSPLTTIEEIKKFVKEKGVVFGIANDEDIGEYLTLGRISQEPCLVAEGNPPEPGRDAQATYYFDRDPLKVGQIRDNGLIDYKDKGEILQVKEGDLLGEKTPMVPERAGIDVYGKTIPVEAAKDIFFFPGPGARKCPEGLKIYARISGRPEVSPDGKIGVLPVLKIAGDVGLETGHVRFEGSVEVDGTVQQGFQIKAGRVVAGEVHRAELEIGGDVVVIGGIVGGKISCKGNLKARYIRGSEIQAEGDVIVEKEVIDSTVHTLGALMAKPAGKIFSSQILAKKGIAAAQIGSDSSQPCLLTVGLDPGGKNRIEQLQEEILARQEEQNQVKDTIAKLNQMSSKLREDMVKWVQVQDRGAIEQRSCKELIVRLEGKKDPSAAEARNQLEKIGEKIRSAERPLQRLIEEEDDLMQKLSNLQLRLEELEGTIQGIRNQLWEFMAENPKKKIFPSIKVSGKIFSGTVLKGIHCGSVIEGDLSRVMIREARKETVGPDDHQGSYWGMAVSPLHE